MLLSSRTVMMNNSSQRMCRSRITVILRPQPKNPGSCIAGEADAPQRISLNRTADRCAGFAAERFARDAAAGILPSSE
ncbi:MAG: hypothetical protein H0W06_12645 [Chloroflexia bacterium]|nr:hypothetical protein [Chloroflexia bacterium]